MNYNFISGSTVDNIIPMLIEAMASGQTYLGFARSAPIWGLSSLICIDISKANNYPNSVIASTAFGDIDGSNLIKFYDKNSVRLISAGSSDFNREVFIVYTDNVNDFDLSGYTMLDNSQLAGGDGKLYLNYLNESWCQIENLTPYYYQYIKTDKENHPNRKYYFLNYTGTNINNAIKISNKTFTEVPTYITDVKLWIIEGTNAPILWNNNLKRSINIIGESLVSGLIDPETPDYSLHTDTTNYFLRSYNAQQKALLMSATTRFRVTNTLGTVLIDDMKYVPPNPDLNAPILWETQTEKYLMLSYIAPDGETVYQKVKVGPSYIEDLGIWNESLPFRSANPVDDSNPPGLDITYLKNPTINRSLFDIEGLIKINSSEVSYIADIKNQEDRTKFTELGFTIEDLDLTGSKTTHFGIIKENVAISSYYIQLYDDHNFVVGDQIIIGQTTYTVVLTDYTTNASSITLNFPVAQNLNVGTTLESKETSVVAKISFATTTDKYLAIKHNFSSILVTKAVSGVGDNSPTDGIYRQLFISYLPKKADGTLCTENIYRKSTNDIFNVSKHSEDIGLLLYISNKIPIYRKYISSAEQFKIII